MYNIEEVEGKFANLIDIWSMQKTQQKKKQQQKTILRI
jgi:hypothetical protein